MKIAIDVSQMCYVGTGVARYVKGLTQELLSESTPHEFILYAGTLRQRTFFTDLSHQKPWDRAKWRIFPLPPKLAGYALNDSSIPFEMLVGSVDLVHASDWGHPSAKSPVVTTVHDLVFKKYPETVDPLILSMQTKRLEKIVKDHSHIIADSGSTKNDLMELYHLPDTQIDVVYPGLDEIYAPQKKTEIDRVKTKYKLPDQYILSVGKQEPRKNITKLIQACENLDLPLVISGKYGWGSSIQLNNNNVISTGFVDESDMPGLYAGATVFAYPSLYEGFGFPVLEAMGCGTPVVTSNISSLPEIVGGAGVLVDPNDLESIRSGILKAASGRDTLIKKGYAQAGKFTWANSAKAVMEVYEKIAHRH